MHVLHPNVHLKMLISVHYINVMYGHIGQVVGDLGKKNMNLIHALIPQINIVRFGVQEIKFRKIQQGHVFCIDNNLLEINSTDIDIESNVIIASISTNYCSNWICTELQVFTNCKEDHTETDICEDLLDTEYNECQCHNSSSNGNIV